MLARVLLLGWDQIKAPDGPAGRGEQFNYLGRSFNTALAVGAVCRVDVYFCAWEVVVKKKLKVGP